jgi:hypothetical protein
MLDRYLAALPAMSLIPFAPFFADFFALLLESPAVCYANPLREKPGRSFTRVTALADERPRCLVISHVLLRGHARNGAADRFSETTAPASLDQLATARGLPP